MKNEYKRIAMIIVVAVVIVAAAAIENMVVVDVRGHHGEVSVFPDVHLLEHDPARRCGS